MIGLIRRAVFSPEISHLVVGHLQGFPFDWRGGFVCVNMCVCVCDCACLRPWEGWLCKPKLAPAMPQSLSEMKDDGSAEPSSRTGYSPWFLWERARRSHTKATRCDTATLTGAAPVTKSEHLSPHCTEIEMRKQREACLSWGRVASSLCRHRWPAVNWLKSLGFNSWQRQTMCVHFTQGPLL